MNNNRVEPSDNTKFTSILRQGYLLPNNSCAQNFLASFATFFGIAFCLKRVIYRLLRSETGGNYAISDYREIVGGSLTIISGHNFQ